MISQSCFHPLKLVDFKSGHRCIVFELQSTQRAVIMKLSEGRGAIDFSIVTVKYLKSQLIQVLHSDVDDELLMIIMNVNRQLLIAKSLALVSANAMDNNITKSRMSLQRNLRNETFKRLLR